MEVEVSLFATFQEGRFLRQRVSLPTKATAADLLRLLAIAPDDVGILGINRRDAPLNQSLSEGDRVTLIPVIGGGVTHPFAAKVCRRLNGHATRRQPSSEMPAGALESPRRRGGDGVAPSARRKASITSRHRHTLQPCRRFQQ